MERVRSCISLILNRPGFMPQGGCIPCGGNCSSERRFRADCGLIRPGSQERVGTPTVLGGIATFTTPTLTQVRRFGTSRKPRRQLIVEEPANRTWVPVSAFVPYRCLAGRCNDCSLLLKSGPVLAGKLSELRLRWVLATGFDPAQPTATENHHKTAGELRNYFF